MDGSRVITIGRQDLYDRIWTTPMMAVCRDYGISNVGLAKVCRRHKIPCPPRGYWAKKHSEKPARRTPLPACPDPERQIIKIYPTPPKQAVPAPAFDADIVAFLDKARQLPMVTVPATLHNPHPPGPCDPDAVRRGSTGPAQPRQTLVGRRADTGRRGRERGRAAGIAVPRRPDQGSRATRRPGRGADP